MDIDILEHSVIEGNTALAGHVGPSGGLISSHRGLVTPGYLKPYGKEKSFIFEPGVEEVRSYKANIKAWECGRCGEDHSFKAVLFQTQEGAEKFFRNWEPEKVSGCRFCD